MNEQPEALRLANELDAVPENGADPDVIQGAASELRRLCSVNEGLVKALRVAVDSDLGRLWVWPQTARETWLENARAAIEQAEKQEGWVLREVLFDGGEAIAHREPEKQEPVREWQGLTDAERLACEQSAKGNYVALVRAVETKLKEKNT